MDRRSSAVELGRDRATGRRPLRCRYCGRPFATPDRLALHRGRAHPDRLTGVERTAYDGARAAERAALRRYKLRAALVLAAVYFGFLFAYATFA